jgi:hypothetical protein
MTIRSGVPQVSVLGPLLFLLYINDIQYCSDLISIVFFADDTNILYSHTCVKKLNETIQVEINKIAVWLNANKLYTGCLKKTLWKFNRLLCITNLTKQFNFLHRAKELSFSFSMIYFLNRNDEKWPHTRKIKIFGRNHILPPLGIENINYAKLINPKAP